MVSVVYALALLLLVTTCIALSMRTSPLLPLFGRVRILTPTRVLLLALLAFDVVCLGILVRFGTHLPS